MTAHECLSLPGLGAGVINDVHQRVEVGRKHPRVTALVHCPLQNATMASPSSGCLCDRTDGGHPSVRTRCIE